MFDNKTRVLLILPQDVLDQARVFAGQTTTKLKRPVSLQMVLRALIGEGLKRDRDRVVLANIEGQVQAVRRIRSRARGAAVQHRTQRRAAGRGSAGRKPSAGRG